MSDVVSFCRFRLGLCELRGLLAFHILVTCIVFLNSFSCKMFHLVPCHSFIVVENVFENEKEAGESLYL